MPNMNTETGIAYGVCDGRNFPLLMEEIFTHGKDETFAAFKEEYIAKVSAVLKECGQRDARKRAESIVDDFEWDDYQEDENEYSYEDEEGNKFLLSYLGGAPLIWCILTSKIVTARPCSPCVPGAGDLDSLSEDGIECYGIPDEYVESEEA